MKVNKKMLTVMFFIVAALVFSTSKGVLAASGTVTTDNLRVRSSKSTESEVVNLLQENEKVEVISTEDEWLKIKADEKTGYVKKEYIKVGEETKKESEDTSNKQDQKEEVKAPEATPTSTPVQDSQTVSENVTIKNAKIKTECDIRIAPLLSTDIKEKAKTGEEYEVVSTVGVWSFITGNNKNGWILTEKLDGVEVATTTQVAQTPEATPEPTKAEETKTETKKYYSTGDSVNIRKSAEKSSEVIEQLSENQSITVVGEEGDWYKVEINGKTGYVLKKLLSSKKTGTTSRSLNSLQEEQQAKAQKAETNKKETKQSNVQTPVATAVSSNPSANAIVAYAKTFLGYRYVYGTNGPNTFDCSGFVQYVYKHFGYSLSRSSSTQANDGVAVSKSSLQPGDVLIFRDTSNSRIGHVGIFIGGDQFIHASNRKEGVKISSLSSASYQKRYVGARRIL